MCELEATCARLAALSMGPTERRRLQALHDEMKDIAARNDPAAFADANHALHSMVYKGAHNALLAETAASIRRRLAPFRRAQFHLEGKIGRAHVCTPVTIVQLGARILLEQKKDPIHRYIFSM